ncbi:hypothetical protein M9H77_02284 [Catharanthus roseus]|uniref:Uncharacterized protein n=1 Tax=Catharanthus roseus TaxID=4058 RepID=A0ACC0C894_CATRO|nr:hypothetical protein M9H77_02284 [Catharanthus roseus]
MESEGSLVYKLYKTISFRLSTSFLSSNFIINESNSCSFPFFCYRIQPQFLSFLTTTCGTKLNHGMKAKKGNIGKKLSIGFEDTSLSLSLNLFLYVTFKELNLVLELYASYVTLVGNVMVNPFTGDLAFDIDHMLKCSSTCSYLEK